MVQAANSTFPFWFLAAASWSVWVVLSAFAVPGKFMDVHKVTLRGSPVCFRPAWLPGEWLCRVYRREWLYLCVCHWAPVALMLRHRLLACASFWTYALLETSLSHWHRDLASCYALAWVLLDEPWARAGAVAVSAHIMFSSGAAKLRVGGSRWPESVVPVLRKYASAGPLFGPLSPALAGWLASHPNCAWWVGFATLVFETGFPLFLSRAPRSFLFVACCSLHAGIVVFQSFGVGFAFLPNVVVYAYAFARPIDRRAYLLAGLSIARFVAFGIAPRDFPTSPFALFAWSGPQWDALHRRYNGRRRLALGVRPPKPGDRLVDRFYSHALGPLDDDDDDDDENTAYDGWERCFGETLVFKPLLKPILRDLHEEKKEPADLVRDIADWLRKRRPLVEVRSGRYLRYVSYVELDDPATTTTNSTIARIIVSSA